MKAAVASFRLATSQWLASLQRNKVLPSPQCSLEMLGGFQVLMDMLKPSGGQEILLSMALTIATMHSQTTCQTHHVLLAL